MLITLKCCLLVSMYSIIINFSANMSDKINTNDWKKKFLQKCVHIFMLELTVFSIHVTILVLIVIIVIIHCHRCRSVSGAYVSLMWHSFENETALYTRKWNENENEQQIKKVEEKKISSDKKKPTVLCVLWIFSLVLLDFT